MWVTNNSEQDLIDGYDGKRYTFASGAFIEVPDVVVRHVFGYGDDNKRPYLQRLGWFLTSDGYDKALIRLNQFSFSSEKPSAPAHVLYPVVEANPLPIPKRKGGGLALAA